MLLEIDHLRIEAGGGAIVDDVSFTLGPGEVLGLIGESGAGKSTVGLAALGYARPGCRITRGRVMLEGTDLLALGEEARKHYRGTRIAYIAQSAGAAFNPAQRLLPQICEVPVQRGLMSAAEAKREAVALFGRLLLPDPEHFGDRYPHQVSGGQLQRAMAAMAMICKPALLVLDEPTTALDVTTQIEVLAILRRLIREDGLAALYITHDLALVAQLATRMMVLRHGKVEEEGETDQVLTRPSSTYAQALIAARQTAPQAVAVPVETPLVEVAGVTARYGSGPSVLDAVSLRIGAGETLAVVGESGSGKSTLARVILGLLPATDGTLQYRGERLGPLGTRSRELRRRIQMVHQMPDLALNPRETIGDAIGRPLELFFTRKKSERLRRVAELLRLVGLPEEIAARWPADLSGGQKQRVCIARALAAEPDLLVCDEVTAALDALVAKEVIALLLRLKRELGMACLLITHDFAVVAAAADRVAVMLAGKVVEQGPCAEVLARPQTEYTARLLAAVPEPDSGWLDRTLARGAFRAVPATDFG